MNYNNFLFIAIPINILIYLKEMFSSSEFLKGFYPYIYLQGVHKRRTLREAFKKKKLRILWHLAKRWVGTCFKTQFLLKKKLWHISKVGGCQTQMSQFHIFISFSFFCIFPLSWKKGVNENETFFVEPLPLISWK